MEIHLESVFVHNLKGFHIKIPLKKFIVITGPSGSGKSSLALFTLAELSKQKFLTLFDYTFPLAFKKIDAKLNTPIPPIISLSQGFKNWYPYKTLAEFLGLNSFLENILFLKGKILCSKCSTLNQFATISQIISWYNELSENTKFYFLIPFSKKKEVLQHFLSLGYTRFLINNKEIDFSEYSEKRIEEEILDGEIYLIVDRMKKRGKDLSRLLENIRIVKSLGSKKIVFKLLSGEEISFNISNVCANCGEVLSKAFIPCKSCEGKGFVQKQECKVCKGLKLSPHILNSKIYNYTLKEILKMDLKAFEEFIKLLEKKEEEFKNFCVNISKILSIGKDLLGNRIKISTPVFQLSAGQKKALELLLVFSNQIEGCMYIFDEPTLGLDPNLRKKLLNYLKKLAKISNGVILIEHDPLFISEADFVIELGYGGGEKGGYLIFADTKERFLNSSTPTSLYLKGESFLEKPKISKKEEIFFKELNISIWKGTINLIWGDTSCEKEYLWEKIKHYIKNLGFSVIEVLSNLKIREKDTVATFSGIWEDLRNFIIHLPNVRAKGFSAKHLSFFTKEGACGACQGKGYKKIKTGKFEEKIICEECLGKKFNPEVLSLEIKGFSLFEILDFTLEEVFTVFERLPSLKEKQFLIESLGISYLKLSQSVSELSGGELNRLFLCKTLGKKSLAQDVFVFLSYPLQGLHFKDIQKFINWCSFLIEKNITCVILDTNPLSYFLADNIINVSKEKIFPKELKKIYQKFFNNP